VALAARRGLPTDGSVRVVFVDKFFHRKTETEPVDEWLGVFTAAWYPFTRHPILDHRHVGRSWSGAGGRKVCFDHAVLTVPPRSSYFYPSRGVPCSPSHMMTSYVDWMLRNMSLVEVAPQQPAAQTVVLTLISRGGPKVTTRRLNNEAELLTRAQAHFGDTVAIRVVDFAALSFREQITTVRESHVLAGMHGAGLTHVLWLPRTTSRVALVEIYNTMDEFTFKDLAALAGAGYFTWEAGEEALHPDGAAKIAPATAKGLNYSPDPAAFIELLARAVHYVRDEPSQAVPAAAGRSDL